MAEFIIAHRLRQRVGDIAGITRALFEAGYAWLDEFIVAKTRELETDIAIALYKAVRLALAGRSGLADQVWLSLVEEEDGFYLFDQRSGLNAANAVGEMAPCSRRDPAASFLRLLATDIPLKELFCRHTLATGQPLRCNLRSADYLDEQPPFALSEHALYRPADMEDPVITLLPVEWSNRPYLFATFPATREAEILPPLLENLGALQTALREQKDRVRVHVRKALLATGRKLSLGGVGEFVGGVIKELSKP